MWTPVKSKVRGTHKPNRYSIHTTEDLRGSISQMHGRRKWEERGGSTPPRSAMSDYVKKQLTDRKVVVSGEDLARFQPSPDFNEAHNRAVIEKTIRDTDANYIRRRKQVHEGLEERSEVVGAYIRHLVHKNDSTPVEKYIGKQYLAQLRGERKLAKIRQMAQEQGYI